tara:strand:+ start:340 stop:567 length:228 start_codon:yes stop_codon:yes gene_type:complete
MKILIIIFSIIIISMQPLKAEEKTDCSKLEKLKDKIGCKINSIKPEKLKGKKLSIGMPKVISEKKTLADFFKKKD